MHVQIVNFRLQDSSEEEYRKLCAEVASAIADLPGLISKVWLANPTTNTYGGVYLWRDREAMEVFMRTEIFQSLGTDPHLADVTSRDFGILEEETRITRGLAAAAV